jgi:hypothetical protein
MNDGKAAGILHTRVEGPDPPELWFESLRGLRDPSVNKGGL